jgi:Short-chain dehydrogenases of various substrate specificities
LIDHRGEVAVITGAASGLGLGLARACAARGMKLALADIQGPELDRIAGELQKEGSDVLALTTDVAEVDNVELLAHRVYQRFGEVHFLFNNAGVLGKTSMLDAMLNDWEWIIGVNMWGIIHGVRAFVPRMLAGGKEGRVINIVGGAGFLSGPGLGIYRMTKHAVVALSESLYHELAITGSKIKVSVVSPAFIKSNLMDAEENRPSRLQNIARPPAENPVEEAILDYFNRQINNGPEPETIADAIWTGIDSQKFYIFAPSLSDDLSTRKAIQHRFDAIIAGEEPVNPLPAPQ